METFLSLFRPKPVGDWESDDSDEYDGHGAAKGTYRKALTAFDLTALGSPAPAVVISYLVSGVVCALSALCYAELAAMIPVSGSAYSYTYATLGEFVAWMIGWDLILEYMVGAASVAVGWAGYLGFFLNEASGGKIVFDKNLSDAPVAWDEATSSFITTGHSFNIPAFAGTILLTVILASGVKLTAIVVNVLVVVKVIITIMFIFGGIKYANSANYQPFTPYGGDGIFKGAVTVFFAYIGFDAVSTTAQEAQNPQRDMPIGIIGSLAVCTVLYVAVCLVLSALLPYQDIPVDAPVANSIVQAGGPAWFGTILALGALAGLTSVMMPSPTSTQKPKPRSSPPLITGAFTAVCAGLLPIDVLANLTSIGTLLAFLVSALAVIVLRIREPHRERPFRVPFGTVGGFLWPALAIASIITLMVKGGTVETVLRVLIWLAIGLVIYFTFGFWNSKLRHPEKWDPADLPPSVTSRVDVVDGMKKGDA
ncbi:amino acid permease-domain-containing protein [Zopfochytrium polystomum]|nr:amino acid permease-domain-containing protein [Zopfochytrium polystomum]